MTVSRLDLRITAATVPPSLFRKQVNRVNQITPQVKGFRAARHPLVGPSVIRGFGESPSFCLFTTACFSQIFLNTVVGSTRCTSLYTRCAGKLRFSCARLDCATASQTSQRLRWITELLSCCTCLFRLVNSLFSFQLIRASCTVPFLHHFVGANTCHKY